MNDKFSIKKILVSLILSFFCILGIFQLNVYAAGSNFQLPSFLNRYDIYNGGSSYTPDYSNYPFNKNSVTSIGFDRLYDTDKSFFKYKGEVPQKIAEEDYAEKFRTYDGNTIDGNPRPWSDTNISKEDLKPSNTDPHIWAMTVNVDSFNFGSIVLSIISAINWLATKLIDIMITFKGFNIASLVGSLDNGGLSNQLSKIFLIDSNTGILSPFLVFGLAVFSISFISLAIKVVKGKASGRHVASEFGFFILALLISSAYLNPHNATKVSKIGIDFMTALSNDITTSANDSTSIFKYSTGDNYLDNISTQKALINKTYIDQLIEAQFGYPVNDLYLVNQDGGNGSFGSKEEIQQAMKDTFGPKGNINSMAVSTDLNGENKINNLGYYLWAANSGVGIYNGTSDTSTPFYSSGNKTLVRTGSSDRMLYVVDFLSNLRKIQDNKGNKDIINKIDRIMNHLTKPSYTTAISNVFMVTLQNLALTYSLFSVFIFTVIGQAIITLGSFCMVVLPILLLFNGTRSAANKMVYSLLLGFLRFLIGSAIFNTIILISTLLSQQGLMGIVFSTIVCIILGKFGPNLIREINIQITQIGRGKELRIMSNVYHNIDKGFGNYSYRNRKLRNKNALVIDENGQAVKTEEANKPQEGLSKFDSIKHKFSKEGLLNKWDNMQKANGNEILNEHHDLNKNNNDINIDNINDGEVNNIKDKSQNNYDDSNDSNTNNSDKNLNNIDNNYNLQRSIIDNDNTKNKFKNSNLGLSGVVVSNDQIHKSIKDNDYHNLDEDNKFKDYIEGKSKFDDNGNGLELKERNLIDYPSEKINNNIDDNINKNENKNDKNNLNEDKKNNLPYFEILNYTNNTEKPLIKDTFKYVSNQNLNEDNIEPKVDNAKDIETNKSHKPNLNINKKLKEIKEGEGQDNKSSDKNEIKINYQGKEINKNIDNLANNEPKIDNINNNTINQKEIKKDSKQFNKDNIKNKINDTSLSNSIPNQEKTASIDIKNLDNSKNKNIESKIDNIDQNKNNINDKEKIIEVIKKDLGRKATNTTLKTVNKIPFVGPKINKTAANKIAQKNKNKNDLKEEIAKKVSESNDKITLNEAYTLAKENILGKTSKNSVKYREKAIDNAKENLNKNDIKEIKSKIKLNKNK